METSGDQINKKINIQEVGLEFIDFYFQNIKTNLNILYESNMIRNYTRIKYKNVEYKEQELYNLLNQLGTQINFFGEESIIMDSGARRADILVNGYITQNDDLNKIRFCQYFTIANNHEGWFIHNSLLSILL
jgi:hypothetical protein|tara:strand:- start:255 stop:650 length:396 start_codon:yes stop_codon:yes gene_type:complete